ncbi:hypothetical protein L1987_87317 [Smallanthus sonchifolius]|nr:hypothetical protein L1987_87317 [Smallanthus sonchifolius]
MALQCGDKLLNVLWVHGHFKITVRPSRHRCGKEGRYGNLEAMEDNLCVVDASPSDEDNKEEWSCEGDVGGEEKSLMDIYGATKD